MKHCISPECTEIAQETPKLYCWKLISMSLYTLVVQVFLPVTETNLRTKDQPLSHIIDLDPILFCVLSTRLQFCSLHGCILSLVFLQHMYMYSD